MDGAQPRGRCLLGFLQQGAQFSYLSLSMSVFAPEAVPSSLSKTVHMFELARLYLQQMRWRDEWRGERGGREGGREGVRGAELG